MIVDVVIPALNEEKSIASVLQDIPKHLVRHIVVVDNGSTDNTSRVSADLGAVVIVEPERGYGAACLAGIAFCRLQSPLPDVICFIDADYSDYPSEMPQILNPIFNDEADLVIGSRASGVREKGAMMPQQIFGNWLATTLLRWFYNVRFTDLGPFRAIKFDSLMQIGMADRNFGWTVEMQLKAAKNKLRCVEVPVSYRQRIGTSKVSGTLKGSFLAGYKILYTIFRYL